MADRATMASAGKLRYYAEQVNASNGVLLLVLLEDGCEADSTLLTHDTLADVLSASANVEAAWTTGTPYARKAYATVSIARDNTSARWNYDVSPDPTWATAATPTTTYKLSKIGVCYAPAANSANSAVVPLTWLDFPATADGSNLTFAFDASGFSYDLVS